MQSVLKRVSMWNYLRVRGEYSVPNRARTPTAELPPRARRIRIPRRHPHMNMGTTSACAENTQCPTGPVHPQRNYLRVRGEYASPAGTHT